MNQKEGIREIIQYWLEKAQESLDAARDEKEAGRLTFSVNRIYYACFYSASAALLQSGHQFRKHSGVRAAFHHHLVKEGRVSRELGQLYDELFEARQRGDYIGLVSFEREQVEKWLHQANEFVNTMKSLVKT